MVYVTIADKGMKLLDELEAPLRKVHDEQAKLLTPDEWRTLSRLLVTARQRPEAGC